jgi:predicted transcriptional regulator
MAAKLQSHDKITGEQRAEVGRELKTAYEAGASIRELAEDIGRSYGFVHRLLEETGVEMRARGGSYKHSE